VWSLPWREYAEEFSSAKARMQQKFKRFSCGAYGEMFRAFFITDRLVVRQFSQKVARSLRKYLENE
jgi:hypothetical protein